MKRPVPDVILKNRTGISDRRAYWQHKVGLSKGAAHVVGATMCTNRDEIRALGAKYFAAQFGVGAVTLQEIEFYVGGWRGAPAIPA